MIGDVLTSSILFEALRAQYPQAVLHYLIYRHTLPVVENNPFIDKFIIYEEDYKKPTHLLPFLKEIRGEKYDVVIDVYSKLGTALISAVSGAPITISYKKWYTRFSYTHPLPRKSKATTNAGLAIEHRLDLLKPLLKKFPAEVKPKIYLTDSEIKNAKNTLINSEISPEKPLIMISVLGSSADKTYPAEYLAQLLDQIVTETNANLLFNYIPSQREAAEHTFQLCNPETQLNIHLGIFGKSLREFMALTSQCDALIGNEGGAVNMAKAMDIPTFAIFSPVVSREDWSLFENETGNSSVHLRDHSPHLFESLSKKELKERSAEYYQLFRPNLIKDQLSGFLRAIKSGRD
ncbi:glycosyltransferase family 9 protein [Antarcticibacterium arcticum]|nr:glycosyltransferase family 9 protein [Antarcticibacterium arcticum]